MAAVDFITLLGRVLHDGALRDAFASDAAAFVERSELFEQDRARFLQLAPHELECQAQTLLRKRFDLVRLALPETCAALDRCAFPEFERAARTKKPESDSSIAQDVVAFLDHLRTAQPEVIDELENNRVRFHRAKKFGTVHLTRANRSAVRRPGIQIFMRRGRGRWSEWRISFGF